MPESNIPDDLARNAQEARMLMDHPLLRNALDTIEQGTIEAIKNLKFGTQDGEILRDKLMLNLQVIDQFKEQLNSHLENLHIMQIKTEEY